MKQLRVLVAEDNEDHLFFIVRALRSVDGVELTIEAVRDGEEALDFLHRRGRYADQPRPHLILLDLKMPRLGGLEVLELLKADAELRTIPVCVLTSSDAPGDVDAAYRGGTNGYVVKSADPSELHSELAGMSEFWTRTCVLPAPPA